ncbi:MFS transporter [Streptomyces umbrinus]|uniref:MFS transporter n=1 Tax=Streptomyces umbrinus TaxID=67370 RepID=UPI0027D8A179|nr:MFS transporter [Streptomyces umbrinus]
MGEVVGASLLGVRLRRNRMKQQLSAGLLTGALAFCGLSLAGPAPACVLIVLAFLAGAAPAACPGGIRTMLTQLVTDGAVPRALSAETTLTQITWAAAPALVVFLALQVHAGAPLLLGALCAAAASILLLRLPTEPQQPPPAERAAAPLTQIWLLGWPVYLTSAASMAMLAAAELVLPAFLEQRQVAVGWSGPLLVAFALASAAGAFCYGLRLWPGSVQTQSLVLLVAMAGCLLLITVLPGASGITVGFLLAGVFQSGVMITRNLSLREQLPSHMHAAAYSVLYALGGLGYSLAAALAAVALDLGNPSAAIIGGVAITLLFATASAMAEKRSYRH